MPHATERLRLSAPAAHLAAAVPSRLGALSQRPLGSRHCDASFNKRATWRSLHQGVRRDLRRCRCRRRFRLDHPARRAQSAASVASVLGIGLHSNRPEPGSGEGLLSHFTISAARPPKRQEPHIDQVFFVFRETTRLGQSQDRSQPPCPLRVRTSCSRRQGCRWWLGELRSGDSARITNNAQCHFPQEGHFRTRLARQDFKHLAGRCVHRPTATQAPIAQPVVITTLEVVNSIHTIYDGLPVQAEHAPRRHKPVEAQR